MEPQPTRIVPGAPPPVPLSKSQKKKRKTKVKSSEDAPPASNSNPKSAPLVEKADTPDVQQAPVGPEPVAQPLVKAPSEDDPSYKASPIVELVHKRLKATSKKIVSITRCHFFSV